MGLTIQCAQCHSHKYDPLTQTEYYQMFAFLNNCHEAQISVYTPEEQAQWDSTAKIIETIEDRLREANPDWRERMAEWEKSVRHNQPTWTVVRPPSRFVGRSEALRCWTTARSWPAGYAPTKFATEFTCEAKLPKITAVRLELMNDPNLPHGGPGRSIYGTCALTEFKVEAVSLEHPRRS